MNNPLVSFFLSTYNRKDEILKTLGKIYEQSYRPIEVIVVDNCSSDGSSEAIKEKFSQVKCLRTMENIGGVAARNMACREATGKYLVSLDDDSFPGRECVTRMVKEFECDPRLGLIAFNVYNQKAFIANYYDEAHLAESKSESENYYWSGCGGGYRQEIVEQYGYWEEWGHTSPYELGISAKVMKAGMIAKNFSDLYVFHAFASDDTEKNDNKWGFAVDSSFNYRTGNPIANFTSARSSLMFVLKYYPLNIKTLIWLIKYSWCVAVDCVSRRRSVLLKALLSGLAKTPRLYNERIALTPEQAEKITIGFNFKGK